MEYYIPPSEKVGGHVPRDPHQIAHMPVCICSTIGKRILPCSRQEIKCASNVQELLRDREI